MMVVNLAPLVLVMALAVSALGQPDCPTDDPSWSDKLTCIQNYTCFCKITNFTINLSCSEKTNTLELYDKRSGIPLCPRKLYCNDNDEDMRSKYSAFSCYCKDEMKLRSKQWKENEVAKQLSSEPFRVTLNMIPHPNHDFFWYCSAAVFVAIGLFLTCAYFSIYLDVPVKMRKMYQINATENEPIYQELNLKDDASDQSDPRPLEFYKNTKSIIAERPEYLVLKDI